MLSSRVDTHNPAAETDLATQSRPREIARVLHPALPWRSNGTSYTSAHSILKHDLDRVPAIVDVATNVVPIQHANLRGPAYYQQALTLLEA